MNSNTASIFRPDALRRYAVRCVEPVFPRSAAPAAFTRLWVLLASFVSVGGLILCCRFPVYVRGVATINASGTDLHGRPLITVLVPADQLARVQIGGRVLIKTTGSDTTEFAQIVSITGGALGQRQAEQLWDHTASAAPTLDGLTAVALAELDPTSTSDDARTNDPGWREALVEVGSRRVITLFRWGQSNQ